MEKTGGGGDCELSSHGGTELPGLNSARIPLLLKSCLEGRIPPLVLPWGTSGVSQQANDHHFTNTGTFQGGKTVGGGVGSPFLHMWRSPGPNWAPLHRNRKPAIQVVLLLQTQPMYSVTCESETLTCKRQWSGRLGFYIFI